MKGISSQWIAWIILFSLALIWGSSFILIKKGLNYLTPEEIGALRIVSASAILLPFAILRLRKIKARHIAYLISVGFVGSLLPAFLFAKAQTQIDSSAAGILNALTPLFTILIGFIFFGQKFGRKTVIGLILGFVGTIFLILSGSGGDLSELNFYALFVVLATIFYAINLNVIKYRLPDLSSITITSISLFFVGPLALLYMLLFTNFFLSLQAASEGFVLAASGIALLGVLGTAIALILFNQLVKITQPVFASSVTYLIPIVAVIWGLIDGEIMRTSDYIGLMTIILGVYLANARRNKK